MSRATDISGRCRWSYIVVWAMLGVAACAAPPRAAVSPKPPGVQSEPALVIPKVSSRPEDAEPARLLVLSSPKVEQRPFFLAWVTQDLPELLQIEGLRQLAWTNDPHALEAALRMLASGNSAVRATAAQVLAEYGSGNRVKAALHQALEHEAQLRPELLWALVELGDTTIFEAALEVYTSGGFQRVTTLDGFPAFDEEKLAAIASTERLKALVTSDEESIAGAASTQRLNALTTSDNPKLRLLAACGLARRADPSAADLLIRLMYENRPEEAVLRAAPGLARMGTPKALETLGLALMVSDRERFRNLLESLRENAGARGLVAALSAPYRDEKEQRLSSIFRMLNDLDLAPGTLGAPAADGMLQWLTTNPHPHFKTAVGLALAEMGDLRALPILAERLRQDAFKLYPKDDDFESPLRRDDNERVVAARLIADLAVAYPSKVQTIRPKVESSLIAWLHDTPSPHANGLRALAQLGSTKDIAAMRSWSNPREPLPQEGQQPPMPEEWIISQVALRAVGALKDKPSWAVLLAALKRRPEHVDVTMDSLMQGGLAILGMSLRAVGKGAADGLSEWGDRRAFEPLLAYIEGPQENEQSRLAACEALTWIAHPEDGPTLVSRILRAKPDDKNELFVRSCLLEGLIARPLLGASQLLSLLSPDTAVETRHQVARAIGVAGITRESEATLLRALNDKSLRVDAALSLMLGADAATAARAVITLAKSWDRSTRDELEELWHRSFGNWSEADLSEGRIYRWLENARAISHLSLDGNFQNWALVQLQRQLVSLHFDNGPHSLTRPVLRARLTAAARGTEPRERDRALAILEAMCAKDVLISLRDQPGELGRLSERAYHRVTHPVASGTTKFDESNPRYRR